MAAVAPNRTLFMSFVPMQELGRAGKTNELVIHRDRRWAAETAAARAKDLASELVDLLDLKWPADQDSWQGLSFLTELTPAPGEQADGGAASSGDAAAKEVGCGARMGIAAAMQRS
jgi:hypothetical protein